MKWRNELTAWLLMISGLGTIVLLMGSTFYVVLVQSIGYFNLSGDSQFSLEYWQSVLQDPVLHSALFYSVKVSILGAFGAVLLSYPLALWLRHTVLTLPYSIRIMSAGFKAVPQDLIDASRDLGASHWGTFCNAFLPMLKPSFLAALIFCLVRSLEEFSISYVLGAPDFITVPTILYSFLGYSFVRPDAAVVSMILVIPNVVLMVIIEKLLKGNYLSQSTGKA